MTAVANEVWGRPEPDRDRYGRYMIIPDGEKKPVAHTRATTVAGTLDNRYALEGWGKRQVLIGASRRPDVIARAATADPEDKDLLNQLVETCEAAATNDAKANVGSAVHAGCEQADLGHDVTLPAPYDQDVAAWRRALEHAGINIIPELVEQVCVLPEYKVAGTFDRIVEFGSYRYVLDIKTGSIDYSMGKNSIQLAQYAHASSLYDPVTKKHRPMPQVEQDLALIAHIPAGQGRCEFHWLNIELGWEAFQHAMYARTWQRRSDLSQAWAPGEATEALGARRIGMIARIQTLAFYPYALEQLAAQWPAGVPTFKSAERHSTLQLDAIHEVLCAVEKTFRAPFGPDDPADNRQ